MATQFTGTGRSPNDHPNLKDGYTTILFARIVTDADSDRLDAMADVVDAWFASDETSGFFDWTTEHIQDPETFHRTVELYYHFSDPETAFRFKIRFV